MFDLERALAKWRAELAQAGFSSARRIDELESHLLEEYSAQIASGLLPADAFARAIELLGNPLELNREFLRASSRRPLSALAACFGKVGGALALFLLLSYSFGRVLGVPIWEAAIWLAQLAFWSFCLIWGANTWLNRRKHAYFETPFWLSAGSKRAVELARIEGGRRNHDYVGTEHLLLGLLATRDQMLLTVLDRCAISAGEIRAEIDAVAGEASQHHDGNTRPATPRLRRALQLATDEAKKFGQDTIAPVHLLAGLLLEGDGLAARVLKRLGADYESLRNQLKS
jgi:hypothetical protein